MFLYAHCGIEKKTHYKVRITLNIGVLYLLYFFSHDNGYKGMGIKVSIVF